MSEEITITSGCANFAEGDVVNLSGFVSQDNGVYRVSSVIDGTSVTLRHLNRWQRMWERLKTAALRLKWWVRDAWYEILQWDEREFTDGE